MLYDIEIRLINDSRDRRNKDSYDLFFSRELI